MATKPATIQNQAKEGRPVQKSKKVLFIAIALIVVFLLGAGAAWFLASKKAHDEDDGDAAAEPAKKVQVDRSQPPVFIALDPFTVNLQPENGDQYLQVVLNFRAADSKLGEEVKQYMPEIRHHILMLLSAKKASEVGSVDGREKLAAEICTESNKVLGNDLPSKKKIAAGCNGPIVAVLFTSFIIQ